MIELVRKADRALLAMEKALCLLLVALMSVAVFLDVVHRLASTSGPWGRVALPLTWLLCFGAFRTAKVKTPMRPQRAALVALGATALGWGFIHALLWLLPNGLVGSQVFALCAMLWVGFLGASIAANEGSHLTLEITEFLWRGKVKAWVGRIGSLAAAVFCAALGWLCWAYVRYQHQEWVASEGLSGVLDGFPVPKFAVYAILPWVMATLTLRFLARAFFPKEAEAPPLQPLADDLTTARPTTQEPA